MIAAELRDLISMMVRYNDFIAWMGLNHPEILAQYRFVSKRGEW